MTFISRHDRAISDTTGVGILEPVRELCQRTNPIGRSQVIPIPVGVESINEGREGWNAFCQEEKN